MVRETDESTTTPPMTEKSRREGKKMVLSRGKIYFELQEN